jgi:hypothetical protein
LIFARLLIECSATVPRVVASPSQSHRTKTPSRTCVANRVFRRRYTLLKRIVISGRHMAPGKSKGGGRSRLKKLHTKVELDALRDHDAMHPPPFSPTLIFPHSCRWFMTNNVGTQGAQVTVTYTNMADWINVAASATTAFQLFNASVRMRRVRIWSPAISNAGVITSGFCYIDPSGSSNVSGPTASSRRIADNSTSLSVPAYVSWKPKRQEGSSMWHTALDGDVVFGFACSAGSTIQVDYVGSNNEAVFARSVAVVPAAATAGSTYQTGITGQLPASAPVCVPIGFSPLV